MKLGMRASCLVSLAILLMVACAPSSPGSGQGAAQETGQAASGAPKLLTMGIVTDAEPKDAGIVYGGGAGGSEPKFIFHAALTAFDDQANVQPRVAERVPTVENGDWKLLPDGRMEVTWKLRPDVVWHDGTRMTAQDFVLGYKLGIDQSIPFTRGGAIVRQISDVIAPDDQTLVMTWKNVYIFANRMGLEVLPPLHRQLAPLYEMGDPIAFAAHPAWAEQWIGAGPYRLKEWVRGSHIEAEAFDRYFLGKPKVDRLIIRYVGDTRSMLVQIRAGELAVVPVGSLKESEAEVLTNDFQAAGLGKVILSNNKLRNGFWNFRDPNALWVPDPRVRLGLTKFIDRQAIVDTVQSGLSSVDDIMLPREDPAYRLAQQRGLPNLSLDPAAGHRMLADAGFTRGGDGLYRSPDGRPFAATLTVTGDIQTNVTQLLVIEDNWKRNGLQPTLNIIPPSAGSTGKDEGYSNTHGVVFSSSDLAYSAFDGYISKEISTEQRGWRGANPGAYSDPTYDAMYDRLLSTVRSAERDEIAADITKYLLDRGLYIPISYSSDVSTVQNRVRNVTGVLPAQRVTSWNIHLWDIN